MKKQALLTLAAAIGAMSAGVFAGDQSQTEKPEMFCIYKEHVHPGKVEQYETAMKNMISEFRSYQIDPEKVNFKAVSGPEIGYAYVMPIDGFADMDKMKANWMEAIEILGKDKFADIIAPAEEATESIDVFHVVRRADLSYEPENPRLKPEEVEFIHYGFYYAVPGKEKDLEAIAKEFADLYRSKGISTGFSVYQCITGSDLPLYAVTKPARSAADFHANHEKVKEALGPKADEIGARIGATVRKIEYKEGNVRPDLSYVAEHAAAAAPAAKGTR